MKTKVEILKQETLLGREFNIYGDFENPLFLAKDVAEWIEYGKNSNGTYNVSQMVNTIDDERNLLIMNSRNYPKSAYGLDVGDWYVKNGQWCIVEEE